MDVSLGRDGKVGRFGRCHHKVLRTYSVTPLTLFPPIERFIFYDASQAKLQSYSSPLKSFKSGHLPGKPGNAFADEDDCAICEDFSLPMQWSSFPLAPLRPQNDSICYSGHTPTGFFGGT